MLSARVGPSPDDGADPSTCGVGADTGVAACPATADDNDVEGGGAEGSVWPDVGAGTLAPLATPVAAPGETFGREPVDVRDGWFGVPLECTSRFLLLLLPPIGFGTRGRSGVLPESGLLPALPELGPTAPAPMGLLNEFKSRRGGTCGDVAW